ncbi:MAG: hypothetical protein ABFD09_13765 [Proteiniphilum sp.]
MKRSYLKIIIILIFVFLSFSFVKSSDRVIRVPAIDDTTYENLCYFFVNKEITQNNHYKMVIDSIAEHSRFSMVFLTGHYDADFYDFKTMYPFFRDFVAYAHERKIKVGLQLWNTFHPVAIENTSRCIVEGELVLDNQGNGKYIGKSQDIRYTEVYPINVGTIIKSELFKVYTFAKISEGFYDPASLKEITSKCTSTPIDKETVAVTIKGGKSMAGKTAYIMTQHYYNFPDNYSEAAIGYFEEALKTYSDIPFDGFALDEYGNMRVNPPNMLKGNKWRGRLYSLPMSEYFNQKYKTSLENTLFDMRYVPEGDSCKRMRAINRYMVAMREGPLRVERAVCEKAKEIFGKDIFIGFHNTHHNNLLYDEIWTTGNNWWTIPREYGQTDEGTPKYLQLGIGMAQPANAIYNMYYTTTVDGYTSKAFNDLLYGIRTNYLAYNDRRIWRRDLFEKEMGDKISRVENCANLLNKFNPLLPETKVLVVFGIEALSNWYPDESARSQYDINGKIDPAKIAQIIWKAGYVNALVSSDVIIEGKLIIGDDGKPVMNGHKFDQVVYLYPQYSREREIKFLEDYLDRGGKLMIEGTLTHDFNGTDVSERFKSIYNKATVKGFSVEKLEQLGAVNNIMTTGCKNEDGSYTFTDYEAFKAGSDKVFDVIIEGDNYSVTCEGFAAIEATKKNGLIKLAANGFKELKKNGSVILSLDKSADIFVEYKNDGYQITLADKTGNIKILNNTLY